MQSVFLVVAREETERTVKLGQRRLCCELCGPFCGGNRLLCVWGAAHCQDQGAAGIRWCSGWGVWSGHYLIFDGPKRMVPGRHEAPTRSGMSLANEKSAYGITGCICI